MDDVVGISLGRMDEAKRSLIRSIDASEEAKKKLKKAMNELETGSGSPRLRKSADDIGEQINRLNRRIEKIGRVITNIDYAVRRFQEVDNNIANRVKNMASEIRGEKKSLMPIENIGIMGTMGISSVSFIDEIKKSWKSNGYKQLEINAIKWYDNGKAAVESSDIMSPTVATLNTIALLGLAPDSKAINIIVNWKCKPGIEDTKALEKVNEISPEDLQQIEDVVGNKKYMDAYKDILDHADAGNKKLVENLSREQIKELGSQLEYGDGGFWERVRNDGTVNAYIRKAFNNLNIEEKINKFLMSNPIATNLSAGFGGIDENGEPIKPVSTGNKVVDWVLKQGGGLLQMKAMGAGVEGGLGFGTTENIANDLLIKNTGTGVSALSKAAQYGVKSATNAVELGYFNGVNTGLQGGTNKEILNSALDGATFGALFGTTSKFIGDEVAPRVINSTSGLLNQIPSVAKGNINIAKVLGVPDIEKPVDIAKTKVDPLLQDVSDVNILSEGHNAVNFDKYKKELADQDPFLIKEQQNLVEYNNLRNTSNFTEKALNHVFQGNKSGGYHYEGLPETPGKVLYGTREPFNNYGVYKGKVIISGIPKSGNNGISHFFPEDMTPQQIIDSANEAFANKQPIPLSKFGNSYRGYIESEKYKNMLIDFNLDKNGKIITFYPAPIK